MCLEVLNSCESLSDMLYCHYPLKAGKALGDQTLHSSFTLGLVCAINIVLMYMSFRKESLHGTEPY